jgi:dTDP-4-amino-4,6-dideoxygalactose transaminase
MQIPFHKPYITDDEINEVVDSLKSGWLTMGPKTVRFEEEFGNYTGAKHSIAVNSCTAALHLALKAINLKAGDEVIIPSMTFTATGEVVCYFDAKPVLVDVERETHNIDLSAIEKAVTSGTRAIIPVHFAGQPCDMEEIMRIAEKYHLNVIEDAAHSLPASYRNMKIGTIGDITCFSFYATKTLATGEGGMVSTGDDEWAERIKILRLHGISKDAWKRYSSEGSWYYEVIEAGYKYNMTDIQAALGLAQLRKLEQMLEMRKKIAQRYSQAFKTFAAIEIPTIKPDRESAWHLYVIKLNPGALTIDRNRFITELKEKGVGASVHFVPLHRHPFYRDTFGYNAEDFPISEWLYERTVSLPIYPGMTDRDLDFVIESVSDVCRKFKR